MNLSIIIVNWNTGELLYNCVKSINENMTDSNYEIIITDNDSKDNSCSNIESDFKNVKIIYSKDNLGFSKGNNIAVKEAKGEYVLFLNPDTIILDNSIEKALDYIKCKCSKKDLVGVRLLNGDRTLQFSSCKFPKSANVITSSYVMSKEWHYKNHNTDWVMGAFMLMKRDFFNEIGGFNESFFMYSEDIELCFRVKKNGGNVKYLSDAEIVHLYNQSGKNKWNKKRDKVVTDSTIKFIRENYSFFDRIITIFILRIRSFIKLIVKR